MVERYLIFWLTLSSLLAYFWPGLTASISESSPLRIDPFSSSQPYLGYLITVAMLAVGSLLPSDEIRQVGKRWHSILLGTCVQYLSMPLLAYTFGTMFQLPTPILIGVIMVGCVPGAMASNVLTLVARGNVSYSVGLTTLATLVSPLVVPFAFYLLLRQHVDSNQLWSGCKTLALNVVLPVLVGFQLSRSWGLWDRLSRRWASLLANLAILWIIAVVVGVNRDRLGQVTGELLVVLLLINGFGYLAGYGAGYLFGLPEPMRRALTIEVGMQNAGVGTVLVLQLFPNSPEAAIPTALYTFGCMFTGTLLAQAWRWTTVADQPASEKPSAEPTQAPLSENREV